MNYFIRKLIKCRLKKHEDNTTTISEIDGKLLRERYDRVNDNTYKSREIT